MQVEYGLENDRARLIDAIEETIDAYCAYGIEDEKIAGYILAAIDAIEGSKASIMDNGAWLIRTAWDYICYALWPNFGTQIERVALLSAEPKAYRHTLFNFVVDQQWYNHA